MPELGQLSHNEIAALVGLAPFNCDSGMKQGYRRIRGGRSRVREALYMAVLSAKRYHPDMKKINERLLSKQKAPKVVSIACARKLLIQLNALIRDGRSWTQTY